MMCSHGILTLSLELLFARLTANFKLESGLTLLGFISKGFTAFKADYSRSLRNSSGV
jgi:thermostable 8-oxoguanine DNA glycosylase